MSPRRPLDLTKLQGEPEILARVRPVFTDRQRRGMAHDVDRVWGDTRIKKWVASLNPDERTRTYDVLRNATAGEVDEQAATATEPEPRGDPVPQPRANGPVPTGPVDGPIHVAAVDQPKLVDQSKLDAEEDDVPHRVVVPTEALPYMGQCNDDANGLRFVRDHGGDMRHVAALRKWRVYDGTRWADDTTQEAMRRAQSTARRIAGEAAEIEDDKARDALLKWEKASRTDTKLRAMLAQASAAPGIALSPTAFDADPYLFNTEGGTLDLRTFKVRPHNPGDLITNMAPVQYTPDATAPLWDSFLAKTLPDPELRAYVQRMAGISLFGEVIEHVFPVLWGTGRNGKSVFLDTMLALFGSYGWTAPYDLFMRSRDGRVPKDAIADLKGRRLVAASESGDGRHLNEALVKLLTGGDPLNGRKLYQDAILFNPSHTIFLATNHKPEIRSTDLGTWRRVRLIGWGVTITKEEEDPLLGQKLRAELPGIFIWALDGWRDYQENGLNDPPAVLELTREYRDESDVFGDFLDECLSIDPPDHDVTKQLLKKDMFKAYKSWAEDNGIQAWSQPRLSKELKSRGIKEGKTYKGHVWKGVQLRGP